ncbi:MAG: hypothetical protein PUC83_11295 [Fibrobacter sp.]|nr:hypothetical protein [Fibrobacter sp.]
MKQEFMNLQKWKSIDMSRDSAETLIDNVIFIMRGGTCNWENKDDSAYSAYTGDVVPSYYHTPECDDYSYCCAEDMLGGAAMVDNWWTLLPEKKPTSIFPKTATSCLRISRLRPGVFYGEGFPQATPYKVFDVNGILLKQGQTENEQIYVPKTPSILDIEHKKVLLK